jgi:hypothetical protein
VKEGYEKKIAVLVEKYENIISKKDEHIKMLEERCQSIQHAKPAPPEKHPVGTYTLKK